jgi:hypothetical protein
LRQLAEDRIADAAILLAAGRWSGAYYLAGYALECGLKACIARLTNQDDFPRDRKFVEECYTHNLEKLLKAAGLKPALDADTSANPAFAGHWGVARDWQETSRYEQKRSSRPKSSTTGSRINRTECCRGYDDVGK